MCIAASSNFLINAEIMRKYVFGLAILRTLLHIISDELDRGAQAVYPNAMEARFRFQKDVTVEHTDIIGDYQSWHQYVTIDRHEDVE